MGTAIATDASSVSSFFFAIRDSSHAQPHASAALTLSSDFFLQFFLTFFSFHFFFSFLAST